MFPVSADPLSPIKRIKDIISDSERKMVLLLTEISTSA